MCVTFEDTGEFTMIYQILANFGICGLCFDQHILQVKH